MALAGHVLLRTVCSPMIPRPHLSLLGDQRENECCVRVGSRKEWDRDDASSGVQGFWSAGVIVGVLRHFVLHHVHHVCLMSEIGRLYDPLALLP